MHEKKMVRGVECLVDADNNSVRLDLHTDAEASLMLASLVRCSGWRKCGRTKGGLIVMEKAWQDVCEFQRAALVLLEKGGGGT